MLVEVVVAVWLLPEEAAMAIPAATSPKPATMTRVLSVICAFLTPAGPPGAKKGVARAANAGEAQTTLAKAAETNRRIKPLGR